MLRSTYCRSEFKKVDDQKGQKRMPERQPVDEIQSELAGMQVMSFIVLDVF